MKDIPFWTDQFPPPADLPLAANLPERVDVAIIGAGYTGLNAARVLAETGASVAVLEQNTIGWGASSRNGGMATPGIKQALPVIVKKYGLDRAHQFWDASLAAIDLIDALVKSESIDCDWQRNGHVMVAYKRAHFATMIKKQAWLKNEFNHETNLVAPSDMRSEIGSDLFFGGLADNYSGGLHPAKYVFGLARVAASRGAHLCENVAVKSIKRVPAGFELQTSQGPLSAAEVLVATNGYTDGAIPGLKSKVFAVGSYIIVTEPLSAELQARLSPRRRMFYDSKNFLNYFRLTPDGRMLWGGRNNLSTGLDLGESARLLQEQMVRTFPELAGVPISHSWTGKLGLTFDLMPHIGRENGIHYAFGYGGHGLSIATYVGTEAGLMLAGKKQESPFAQIPHQTYFFYRNRPWFLPIAAQYFRLLDRVS